MYHPHFDFNNPLELLLMLMQSMAERMTKSVSLTVDKLVQPLSIRDVRLQEMTTVVLETRMTVQKE